MTKLIAHDLHPLNELQVRLRLKGFSMPKDNTKAAEVLVVAQELFDQDPDWITFFREVLGVDGIVRRAFPDRDTHAAFEQSSGYQNIQRMLAELRAYPSDDHGTESMRVITVRLPQSVHESLKRESEERGTSLNKLAVSKLMQGIVGDLVPKAPVQKEDSIAAAS